PRAESAADLAALAAGGRLLLAPGVACGEAARVAAAHGARLVSCTVSDDAVQDSVVVAVDAPSLPGFPPAHARARAGPLSAPLTPGDLPSSLAPT
ncbi:Rv3654c family TadE-like protein, partial [Streptacidiphilus monticola]